MKKTLLILLTATCTIGLILFSTYWRATQPLLHSQIVVVDSSLKLPGINRQILNFIEARGASISPTYDKAVCTEFVIQVIDNFKTLSKEERKLIRVITDDDLTKLVLTEDPVIKGVQTALLQNNKGEHIQRYSDVRPGDFVQFWNLYNNKAYGHCGIVLTVEPSEKISLYSSHPLTNGFGKQTFMWPDKIFFVRLK